jgi:hypothetical protein
VLSSNGPVLANGSFIAVQEPSSSAKDAESVGNSPNDTPLVTPTKHIQYKVGCIFTLNWHHGNLKCKLRLHRCVCTKKVPVPAQDWMMIGRNPCCRGLWT